MKLLVDSPIPASVTTLSTPELALERWKGGQVGDGEFIRQAEDAGYAGVVLLGRETLSRPDLLRSASESTIGLVVISVNDPIRAHGALEQHFSRLATDITPGRAIVASSQEFTVLNLADLIRDMLQETSRKLSRTC